MLIGADAGQDNEVLLASLERVNAADLHILIGGRLKGTLALHDRDNVGTLTLVGRDDPYLPRPYARL